MTPTSVPGRANCDHDAHDWVSVGANLWKCSNCGAPVEVDETIQEIVEIKTEIANGYVKLAACAARAVAKKEAPRMASLMRCSTNEINTWARASLTFGYDFIVPESDPLDVRWFGELLKSDDPVHWLEQARAKGWNTRQIKAEAGTKQKDRGTTTTTFYDGGGSIGSNGNTVHLDGTTSRRGRVDVRLRERDE